MEFMNYLTQSGLLIATGLFIIGLFLKGASFIPDWLIPIILLALGVLAAVFSMDGRLTVNNILQGVFATGAAVLVNQIGKQTAKKDVGEKFDAAHPAEDVQPVEDLGQVADSTDKGEGLQ